MGWANKPWLGFDTETTGTNIKEDRIVTAAAILRPNDGSEDQPKGWLANPGIEIPQAATDVHGVTNEKAKTEGRPAKEVVDEIATTLVDHWKEGNPVIIFNAKYDLSLLDNELKRHNLPTLHDRLSGTLMAVIDPLVLDRALDKWRKGKRNLAAAAKAYNVKEPDGLHNADVDVTLTMDVLESMTRAYKVISNSTLEELNEYQKRAHRDWAENFENYLRLKGSQDVIGRDWPMEVS